jgi:hypothetical protein
MSFFCLEAGRISSRSTGTPRETRKRRRMRERIQFGGWRGGGATSCDQREALRGVRNVGGDDELVESGEAGKLVGGKSVLRWGSVAAARASEESREEKLRTGWVIS